MARREHKARVRCRRHRWWQRMQPPAANESHQEEVCRKPRNAEEWPSEAGDVAQSVYGQENGFSKNHLRGSVRRQSELGNGGRFRSPTLWSENSRLDRRVAPAIEPVPLLTPEQKNMLRVEKRELGHFFNQLRVVSDVCATVGTNIMISHGTKRRIVFQNSGDFPTVERFHN